MLADVPLQPGAPAEAVAAEGRQTVLHAPWGKQAIHRVFGIVQRQGGGVGLRGHAKAFLGLVVEGGVVEQVRADLELAAQAVQGVAALVHRLFVELVVVGVAVAHAGHALG